MSCESSTVEYISSVSCSRLLEPDNTVLLEFQLFKDIPALETFDFSVNEIMNPFSTKPTDPIEIRIYETAALQSITNEDTGNLIVITTIPYIVDKNRATITQSVEGAGLPSKYTLTMSLAHSIEGGGGLLIRYPSQVVVHSPLKVTVDASAYKIDAVLTEPDIDDSARQILFAEKAFTQPLIVEDD